MIRNCIRLLGLLALLATLSPAQAQTVAQIARLAADQLTEARAQLDRADRARDRVAALTATVQAYETGLAALRDGLRAATIREMELTRTLNAREEEIARLLGVLQSIGRVQGAQTSLHPDGPLGSVRAGMMLASVTPGLTEQAQNLRRDLNEVRDLRKIQQAAADDLQAGLEGVQEARLDLSQALAARTDLPRRFSADPVRTAILISASETLEAFASGLDDLTSGDIPPKSVSIAEQKGQLRLPVNGQILRRAGEADAAGVERPGVVIATAPQALVTTPVPVTLRYRGPLLDYGLVSILEPEPNTLFILAGLETVYGEIGEVLPQGSPIGLMGGGAEIDRLLSSQSGDRGGTARPETLYIEVRQDNRPVDPLTWFTTDKG